MKIVNAPREIVDDLSRFIREYQRPLADGVYRFLEDPVMRESRDECPVLTGNLVRSGSVDRPMIKSGEITIGFGYSAHYATIQHERPDFQHKPGKKWKFLDDPLNRSIPILDDYILKILHQVAEGRVVGMNKADYGVLGSLDNLGVPE